MNAPASPGQAQQCTAGLNFFGYSLDVVNQAVREGKAWLRASAGAAVIHSALAGMSRLARLHPKSRLARHGVELVSDVPYDASAHPRHRLDVYRPIHRPGPWPAVMYVHGGSFRILSKETHWIMGLMFARAGYVVFMPSYRLAPENPFPAALTDVSAAYQWVVENASNWGASDELVVSGESAGANLALAATICAAFERKESWARRIWNTGKVPNALVPACGILQVSDTERFARRKAIPVWMQDRLRELTHGYIGDRPPSPDMALADPLLFLEGASGSQRPLPPAFVPCGTRDVLLDDSRRLVRAWGALGAKAELAVYPGEPHAFHALVWRKEARRAWREQLAFLRALPSDSAGGGPAPLLAGSAAGAAV